MAHDLKNSVFVPFRGLSAEYIYASNNHKGFSVVVCLALLDSMYQAHAVV